MLLAFVSIKHRYYIVQRLGVVNMTHCMAMECGSQTLGTVVKQRCRV